MTGLDHVQGSSVLKLYAYGYDTNRNISSIAADGATSSYTYDALNRILTESNASTTYSYDLRGNRLTMETETSPDFRDHDYQYNKRNMLTQVKSDEFEVEYRYNGDGLLVERIEGDTTSRYYYDGDQMIAEANVVDGVPKFKASYIRGSQLEAIKYADGQKAFVLHNGHGDVVELRDAQGELLNRYEYDTWGNLSTKEGEVYNPFRYSGEYWDDSTGLQYLRARWYDPRVGRFINGDTYEGQIDNPLTLNLYTYVTNNPLRYIDPSGHKMEIDGNIHYGYGDQQALKKAENDFNSAKYYKDLIGMQAAHDAANQIRLKYADSVKRIDFINGGFSSVSKTNNAITYVDDSGLTIQTYVKGEVSLSFIASAALITKIQGGTLTVSLFEGVNGKIGASATLTAGVSARTGNSTGTTASYGITQQLPFYTVTEGRLFYDMNNGALEGIAGAGIGVSGELYMYTSEGNLMRETVLFQITAGPPPSYPMYYQEWMNHLGR